MATKLKNDHIFLFPLKAPFYQHYNKKVKVCQTVVQNTCWVRAVCNEAVFWTKVHQTVTFFILYHFYNIFRVFLAYINDTEMQNYFVTFPL